MALIGADQTFALSAVMMVTVAFGLWAESRTWGQKLGGPLILLAVAMALSNLQIIPYSAPVYDSLAGILVPMAIPLLILRADFKTIFSVLFLEGSVVSIFCTLYRPWNRIATPGIEKAALVYG